MVRINLRRMEVFKAVYELGSASAAARQLNVSQPSVSRLLKDFELDLGFKLFELVKGKFQATPEADRLYSESKPVFAHVAHVSQIAQQLRDGEEGLLRVAVAEYLALEVMPEVALKFAQLFPQVRLHIGVKNLADQQTALANGDLDLGISSCTQLVPGFSRTELGEGVLIGLVPIDHELAGVDVIPDDGFLGRRNITTESGTALLGELMSMADPSIEAEKPIVVSSTLMGVRLAGLDKSMAVVDVFSAVGALGDSLIKPLSQRLTFKLHALHLAIRPLSHVQRKFSQLVREEVKAFSAEHDVYSGVKGWVDVDPNGGEV